MTFDRMFQRLPNIDLLPKRKVNCVDDELFFCIILMIRFNMWHGFSPSFALSFGVLGHRPNLRGEAD